MTGPQAVSASGTREVPQSRGDVWRALAVLQPYCAVCDVSYVVTGKGRGTTFVCVPGRLDGVTPPPGAPRGEIVEWKAGRLVTTRLRLPDETWTTRIELAATDDGGTRVTMTLTHEAARTRRLVRRLQRTAEQDMVQRLVDGELDKVPAHIEQVTGNT